MATHSPDTGHQKPVQLSQEDIDGASLGGREPKDLRMNELRFWLSCRGIKHTKMRTKAELVIRVHQMIDDGTCNNNIIDPTPNQVYLKRKLAEKPPSSTSTTQPAPAPKESTKVNCPTDGWGKDLQFLPVFNETNIKHHAEQSGKNAIDANVLSPSASKVAKQTSIKPETRGYQFFAEGYIHNMYAQKTSDGFFCKANCFRSQMKNATPHCLWVCVSLTEPHDVIRAYCTCIAGASQHCNHVFALMYQLELYHRCTFRAIPDDVSKTSLPQQWDKPRIEGTGSEPVMDCVVKKAKLDAGSSSRQGVHCSLYEARAESIIANSVEKLKRAQNVLKAENPKYGICHMVTPDNSLTEYVKTSMNTYVPRGSLLSYQLALTEGNFSVNCNVKTLTDFLCDQNCLTTTVQYPPLPVGPITDGDPFKDQPGEASAFLSTLIKSRDECNILEEGTRGQTSSPVWWAERQYRLTASSFAEVCKRRKNPTKLVDRLIKKPKLNEVMPAPIRHGRHYEDTAARKYKKYMNNIGHKVAVDLCGFVVRPDHPHLGCSPDRRILDPVAHPHFGILEVKCPYKMRGVTPLNAGLTDPEFPCDVSDGVLSLKRNHPYYYQVQGQMGITGAAWCDFVVYTFKGLHIERVPFDEPFWNSMLEKLNTFYFSSFIQVAKVNCVQIN